MSSTQNEILSLYFAIDINSVLFPFGCRFISHIRKLVLFSYVLTLDSLDLIYHKLYGNRVVLKGTIVKYSISFVVIAFLYVNLHINRNARIDKSFKSQQLCGIYI